MPNNFYTDADSTKKISQGIQAVSKLIARTYGAAGGNVVIPEDFYPFYRITNDGKLIVDKAKLDDIIEKYGLFMLREGANSAEKDSADGRKTTMLLTGAIMEAIGSTEAHPTEIRESLNECLPIIIESIDSEKREVDVDNVVDVAHIASESKETAKIIQEIYQLLGKDAAIEVDNSNTPHTYYERTEGIKLRNVGYMRKYMLTEDNKSVFHKPYVLITRQKISNFDEIMNIINQLKANNIHELVIFCDDIDEIALAKLAGMSYQGHFRTLVMKAPNLFKDWLFEDFAQITGATIVDEGNGVSLKTLGIKHLGTCDRISAKADETNVMGIKDISAHIALLEEKAITDDQTKVRIHWLNKDAAIIKMGANSEIELAYKVKKANDGISSAHHALKDGVVVGGGISLINAIPKLPDTVGGRIMKSALTVPLLTIMENAGYLKDAHSDDDFRGEIGFDAKKRECVNMWEAGIVDASIVVKNAVKNAVSIASTALTVVGVIAD